MTGLRKFTDRGVESQIISSISAPLQSLELFRNHYQSEQSLRQLLQKSLEMSRETKSGVLRVKVGKILIDVLVKGL